MTTGEHTLVLGVDKKHLEQLSIVLPTWRRHKPSLLQCPLVVFFDKTQVTGPDVAAVVGKHPDLKLVEWPVGDHTYEGGDDKWSNPQRYKMLAGFVFVPAMTVKTRYWLKIDTDTVAVGDDDWIDPAWLRDSPGIVAHPWAFTKPPGQIDDLDIWVDIHEAEIPGISSFPPLDLSPKPDASKLRHRRIISWCGFFRTDITQWAAEIAAKTCGPYKLPVPSQDGYMWYVCKRTKATIKRENMKSRGFEHWSTMRNIRQAAERAMGQ